MTTLAQKLDARFQKLDSATLSQVDSVFTTLLSVFERRAPKALSPSSSVSYQLPARSLGALSDLDLTKLAHVDEDLAS